MSTMQDPRDYPSARDWYNDSAGMATTEGEIDRIIWSDICWRLNQAEATVDAILGANVQALAWEDDEKVITVNGRPEGPTISLSTGREVSLIWSIIRGGLQRLASGQPRGEE